MPSPLVSLSPSAQNTKQKSPLRPHPHSTSENTPFGAKAYRSQTEDKMTTLIRQDASEEDEFHDTYSNEPDSPDKGFRRASTNGTPSPVKFVSPLKSPSVTESTISTPSPPSEPTLRFNEGLTRAIESPRRDEVDLEDTTMRQTAGDEGMSTILHHKPDRDEQEMGDEMDITLSIDDTVNDVSAFSAIAEADLTRFAALRNSARKIWR
jgi:hypothetical protein